MIGMPCNAASLTKLLHVEISILSYNISESNPRMSPLRMLLHRMTNWHDESAEVLIKILDLIFSQ